MFFRFSINKYLLLVLLFLSACTSASEQVISGDPRQYLLATNELPNASAYTMPDNGASLVPNAAAIGTLGQQKGQALITETERVTGSRVRFQRVGGVNSIPGPDSYAITVTIHQSAKGARTTVQKYNIASLDPHGGWTVEQNPPSIGDLTVVETSQSANQSGQKVVTYHVEFAYRNASVDVLVAGLAKDVPLTTATAAARQVLAKLQTAPLANPPIPTQLQPDIPQ